MNGIGSRACTSMLKNQCCRNNNLRVSSPPWERLGMTNSIPLASPVHNAEQHTLQTFAASQKKRRHLRRRHHLNARL
jgi:hypothetical protein